jgi:hypothetical protein
MSLKTCFEPQQSEFIAAPFNCTIEYGRKGTDWGTEEYKQGVGVVPIDEPFGRGDLTYTYVRVPAATSSEDGVDEDDIFIEFYLDSKADISECIREDRVVGFSLAIDMYESYEDEHTLFLCAQIKMTRNELLKRRDVQKFIWKLFGPCFIFCEEARCVET